MNGQPFWQYQQISDDLIRQIDTGVMAPGTKLPSEQRLGELYSVSRITIRKALAALEAKDYIEKRQGLGSFVKEPKPADAEVDYFEMPGRTLARRGYKVKINLRDFKIFANGEEPTIRTQMGLTATDYLYFFSHVYTMDRTEVIWRTTYMSFTEFPMITAREVADKEIIPMLIQRFNFDVERMAHNIISGIDAQTRAWLGLPSTAGRDSYVEARTEYQNQDGQIVYISRTISPSTARIFLVGHKEGISMGAPHILLTRIDNRLVHGQVGVTWTKTLGANLILVANDEAAQDQLQQKLMSSTASSSGAGIRFFTIEKTIQIISKAADRQKIFIVVKTPADARKLVEGGVPITELNVGNMHFAPGKVEITKKVYVDDQDKADLTAIVNQGVDVYIQDVPGERKTAINF